MFTSSSLFAYKLNPDIKPNRMFSQVDSVSRLALLEPKISYLTPDKGSVQSSLNLTS